MAKQAGIIRLIGTVGNITFSHGPDGYLAKDKSSLTKERILTDAAFQRTRENDAEFGNAATSGKLMRLSINNLLSTGKDNRLVPRLLKHMLQVVKSDTTDMRGERNAANGDSTLLQGFDFNAKSQLTTVFTAPYSTAVDRTAGTLDVTIPAFVPVNSIVAPAGATHFMIVSAGVELDFAGNTYVSAYSSSDVIAYDGTETDEIDLSNAVTAASTNPLFLVLGIQFFEQVNDVNYSLKNGKYNPLSVVEVSSL
jgi:hypothetical protein